MRQQHIVKWLVVRGNFVLLYGKGLHVISKCSEFCWNNGVDTNEVSTYRLANSTFLLSLNLSFVTEEKTLAHGSSLQWREVSCIF